MPLFELIGKTKGTKEAATLGRKHFLVTSYIFVIAGNRKVIVSDLITTAKCVENQY